MQIYSVALGRVSTADQRKSGSLSRQEKSVYLKADNLHAPVLKYWDEDISSKVGNNFKRKDLLTIYEFCKQNKSVKYLIIDEVDRYMRDMETMFYWRVRLREELGVKQVFADNDELNEETSHARLLLALDAFKAEASNEERQRKSINGHQAAINEGRYTFPPKPGYTKGDKPGVHQPHPIEFKPFQVAMKEVLSGIYSPSEALKRLNDSDFTKSRSPLKIDKFVKFIVDPYYAGIIDMDRQVKAHNEKGQHTPMISVDEHERLKEVVLGRKTHRYQRKEQNPDFPMNQTVCNECEGKLVGFNHNNGKGWVKPKYRCRNCNKQYARDAVHSAIDVVLAPLGLDDDSRSDFLAALTEVWEQRQQGNIQHIKALQSRLKELQGTKDQLVRKLASAHTSLQEDIEEAIASIKGEIKDLAKEIEKASDFQNDLVEFVAFALKFTDQLVENWWALSPENRLRCKQLLFPEGFSFSSTGKVYTPQISPLYGLATTKKNLDVTRDSLLVELRGIAPRSESLQITLLQT